MPEPGEQPEPLAQPAGREAVEGTHAEIDAWPEAGAAGGRRRGCADFLRPSAQAQRTVAIQRASEGVDHAAQPSV